MTFSVPTTVVSKANSAGSTSTSGTFTSAVPSGTILIVGITVDSDAVSTLTSVTDSKSNTYTLLGHEATTINRPQWIYASSVATSLTTSDTLTVTIGSSHVINFIGVAQTGAVFVPTQFTGQFNASSSPGFGPTIPAIPSSARGYIIGFGNGTVAQLPSWAVPGPTVIATLTSGQWFSAVYEKASDFPTPLEIDFGGSSTASITTIAVLSEYTDLYEDAYESIYGQFLGTPWPQSGPLNIKVELLVNGTWVDITSYVYQRDSSVNINITSGKPDEGQTINPATCTVELNNRGGTFSPKNPLSPFYPYIARNTQIRVSAQKSFDSLAGMSYLFWGEVSAWPPAWDLTGNDVWVDITASGITRRLQNQATIGSSIKRFYTQKATTDPTYPIAYWPCEDGSTSTLFAEVTGQASAITFTGTPTLANFTSFAGSDPIPVLNSSVWTGLTGSYSPVSDVVFSSPGTYTWTAPAGVTSVDAICVGGGGGGGSAAKGATQIGAGAGGGEYAEEATLAVTAGTTYSLTVGAGGSGGTPSSNNGQNGQSSVMHGDSVTVTAHGGGYGSHGHAGIAGTGSTNTVHHDGGAGYYDSSNIVSGGGGSSGDATTTGTSATSAKGAAPSGTYGGVGGDGNTTAVQNYVKSYVAQHSYSYAGSDASVANKLLSTDTNMHQGGSASTTNGKSKTWILFDHATIASDLSGATINRVTLTVYATNGGTMAFGWDTTTSFPLTKADPSSHIDLVEGNIAIGQYHTYNIGTQFGTAFKSSSASSIVLFKNSNSNQYVVQLHGAAQSNPPVLSIYYSK